MANRLPLTANKDKKRIEELPPGDYLDLSQSGIVSATSIQAEVFYGSFVGTALTAKYLENATGILTGIVDPDRLSGTYNIDVTGSANFLSAAENISSGVINPERLVGSYDIDISGTSSKIFINETNDNSVYYPAFSASNGSQNLYIDLGQSLTFNPSTNSLGINTNNPSRTLDVFGNARITGIATFGTSSITLNGINNTVAIGTAISLNGNSGIITAVRYYGDGSQLTNLPSGGGGGGPSQWVTVASGIYTGSNVGVGTTSPQTKLQINGVLGFIQYPDGYNGNTTNVLIGDSQTGQNLTPDPPNYLGVSNAFIGAGAGRYNTIGSYNNFFGIQSGYNNNGSYNNFFGIKSGYGNTTGSNNNFFGLYSGYYNTTGSNNNFFGSDSGFCSYNGKDNNFIGRCAGYYTSSGSYNNFFGLMSGNNNTNGYSNIFIGRCAGFLNTSGSYNNFFGYLSGACNTVGSTNIIIGYCASGPSTGVGNFIGGYKASWSGMNNSSYNNIIGWGAACGDQGNSCCNNFIGRLAGACNQNGQDNNFFGTGSGYNNNNGGFNNFLGYNSGFNNRGNDNNFFGSFAGFYNTTGSNNTFIGKRTGISTSASYKIILGSSNSSEFDSPNPNKDNQFAVGLNTSGTSNYWLVGDENFNIGIGTTNPTTKLQVGGTILASDGFISIGNTTPIQILLDGNNLIFNAVGIGSTSFNLN